MDRNPIQTNEMNASDSFSDEDHKLAAHAAPIAKKQLQELDKPIDMNEF